MTDADLVRETLAGHTASYGDLVRRWSARVAGYCHARVARADAVEDLTQETLLRGFTALRTLSDEQKFGPWLLGIAHRVCLDWLKARARRDVHFSDVAGENGESVTLASRERSPAEVVEREEEFGELMRRIEAMPEKYREVLLIYYYSKVTYQDLAQMLGVSTATVNARLTKGRALLRNGSAWQDKVRTIEKNVNEV